MMGQLKAWWMGGYPRSHSQGLLTPPTERADTCGVLSRRREQVLGLQVEQALFGGEGGIRTHGRVTPTAVFETARFGRSRTSPL